MSRGEVIRLVGFLGPAAVVLTIVAMSGDWRLFGLALVAALLVGIPAEVAYRRALTLEEQKRDLEDRYAAGRSDTLDM